MALEFRFNDAGEVSGIFTPARWGRFGGHYRQQPWEGHFSDYAQRSGMRIPLHGESRLVWPSRLERSMARKPGSNRLTRRDRSRRRWVSNRQ